MTDFTNPHGGPEIDPNTGRKFKPSTVLGLSFAALGALALLAPAIATTTTVVFVAVSMLFWGVLGVAFLLRTETFPNRNPAIAGFGLIAAIGAAFLFFPTIGGEILTIFLVAALLLEGVVSLLYAISISGRRKGWTWMAFSGVAALFVGVMVIIGWPATATWLIGLGLGVNFLTTGIAIFALGRSANKNL